MRGQSRYSSIVAVAAAAVLVTSTAGCSSSDGGSTSATGKTPVGSFSTLTGKGTAVVFDAGFLKALTTLGLTPAPVGRAKIEKVGKDKKQVAAFFQITGGHVTIDKKGEVTPYVQGVIDHEGSGLTLTAGKTKVKLANFVIHPGNNSSLTGDVTINGGTPLHAIKLFDLDGSTLRTPTISNKGVAKLIGTKVYLSSEAAAALNGVFKTNALAGNHKVLVGTAVIEATGK